MKAVSKAVSQKSRSIDGSPRRQQSNPTAFPQLTLPHASQKITGKPLDMFALSNQAIVSHKWSSAPISSRRSALEILYLCKPALANVLR